MAQKKKAEEKPRMGRANVAGVECDVPSIGELTYGELGELETEFGLPFQELGPRELNSVRGVTVLAYIARRRVDPNWTLAQTRALKQDEIEASERPTEAPESAPETSGNQS